MKKANRKEIIKMFHFKLSKYWEPHKHTCYKFRWLMATTNLGNLGPELLGQNGSQANFHQPQPHQVTNVVIVIVVGCDQLQSADFLHKVGVCTWVWALRSIMTEGLTDRLTDWQYAGAPCNAQVLSMEYASGNHQHNRMALAWLAQWVKSISSVDNLLKLYYGWTFPNVQRGCTNFATGRRLHGWWHKVYAKTYYILGPLKGRMIMI